MHRLCLFLFVVVSTCQSVKGDARRPFDDKLCPDLVDVAFLLDESSSLQYYDVEDEKKFVKSVISEFNVGRPAAQFSVMTFARYPRVRFNFGSGTRKQDMFQYIDWIQQTGGKTDTYRALQLLRTYTFQSRQGGRDNAKSVGVIITDGQSQLSERTRTEAEMVRAKGVTLIAIGVGDQVRYQELRDITGDDRYIFRVDKYADLPTIIGEISNSICAVCADKKADVFVLLDNTLEAPKDYYLDRYLENLMYSFNVSDSLTQIGLLTYGTKVDILAELNEAQSSAQLMSKLSQATTDPKTYPGATVAALKKAQDRMFNEQLGARKDVAKAVIIITKGEDLSNDLKKVATELREAGVEIYMSVIAHKPDTDKLGNITGNSKNVFTAHSSFRLLRTRRLLAMAICQLEIPQKEKPYECHGKAADVVFMMDESSSITWADYDKEKKFLIDVIDKFRIGLNFTRVGLVTYSSKPKLRFDLDDYPAQHAMFQRIIDMPRYAGNTNTGAALEMARIRIFPQRHGSRKGLRVGREVIPQIGVVITDGQSQDTAFTAEQAKAMRMTGVFLIVVAIGSDVDQQELSSIASASEFVMPVADFNALHSKVDKLGATVCKAARRIATTKPTTVQTEKPTTTEKGPDRGDVPIAR